MSQLQARQVGADSDIGRDDRFPRFPVDFHPVSVGEDDAQLVGEMRSAFCHE